MDCYGVFVSETPETTNDKVVQFPTFPVCSWIYEGFIFGKHPGGVGEGFECLPPVCFLS